MSIIENGLYLFRTILGSPRATDGTDRRRRVRRARGAPGARNQRASSWNPKLGENLRNLGGRVRIIRIMFGSWKLVVFCGMKFLVPQNAVYLHKTVSAVIVVVPILRNVHKVSKLYGLSIAIHPTKQRGRVGAIRSEKVQVPPDLWEMSA